jgi:carboxymethylenebutenolidase
VTDFLAKPKSSARGAVLVLHAWWGLNAFQKSSCTRLAPQGYAALAPDLYDGATARTIPGAKRLRRTVKQDKVSRHILRSLHGLQSTAKQTPLADMGFSMGAYWSLWLAEEKPQSFSSVILFYGTRGGKHERVQSSFLGHFAESDQFQSRTSGPKLKRALKLSGKDAVLHEDPATAIGSSKKIARNSTPQRPTRPGSEHSRPSKATWPKPDRYSSRGEDSSEPHRYHLKGE